MARAGLLLSLCPVLLVGGCIQDPQAPTPTGLIVGSVEVVPRETDPRWAPWHRIEDDFTPGMIYFAVSSTGQACKVTPAVWATLRAGQQLQCEWRASHRLAAGVASIP